MSLRNLLFATAAVLAITPFAGASTFGLENSLGDTPTFSITSGGVTATYSSPAGNNFSVQNTSGLLSFPVALLDNNFFGTDPLTITFSTAVSGTIAIPFALLDAYSTTDSLSIMANTGQTSIFAGIPDNLALGEPEGIANLVLTAPVNSLTLNGTSAFAIGDVSTSAPSVTPEPASLALVATGLAGMAAACQRRGASVLRRKVQEVQG